MVGNVSHACYASESFYGDEATKARLESMRQVVTLAVQDLVSRKFQSCHEKYVSLERTMRHVERNAEREKRH